MLKKLVKQYLLDKKYLPFTAIIIVLIAIRFLWLDKIPVGYAHDEVEYTLNAKTYVLEGRDISGYSFPVNFFRSETEGRISPIPPLLLSVYYRIFELGYASSRVPYVILNILTAFVFFIFIQKLFRNKSLSILALTIFLINPWVFYYSRWGTDNTFALFIYLIAITLYLCKNVIYRYLSFFFLAVGFFTYHGAKPLFLPLAIILVVYSYYVDKAKENRLFIRNFLILVFSFIIIFSLIDNRLPGLQLSGRFSEIFLFDNNIVESIVNEQRKVVISNPFTQIFSNKITATLNILLSKYLQAFNIDTLFFKGDLRATYRFENHGLLFFIDLILIPFGLFSLIIKKRKEAVLLLFLLLIAPIPTAINEIETSVIHRSFLLIPIFVTLSSIGIIYIYQLLNKKIGKTVSLFLLIILISISSMNFFYFYFYRYPVTSQENYYLSERVLANYLIKLDSNNTNVTIISIENRPLFLESLFYFGEDTQKTYLTGIYKDTDKENYYYMDNFIFTNNCPEIFDENETYIVSRNIDCFSDYKYDVLIQNQKDAGTIFKIYNDTVCDSNNLTPWRREHKLSDYAIESMDKQEFCNRWINI
jgi:hypothetical protein